jgi:hypothetical protein
MSTTIKSAPLHDGKSVARRGMAWNKLAAVLAWFGGVFTTWLFFQAAAPDLPWVIAVISATLAQWVLTMAERPLWRWVMRRNGGRFVVMAVIITLLDGLLNAAGIYPHIGRLAQTGVGQMLAEVLTVQAAMEPGAAFLLAFLIGLGFAGLPEALWEQT